MPLNPAESETSPTGPPTRPLDAALVLPEEMPRLSEQAMVRMPSLREYQQQLDQWWMDTREALLRQFEDIQTQIDEID